MQTHHWMWKRLDTAGYEQVTLQEKQNGWLADGVGVWLGNDEPVRYGCKRINGGGHGKWYLPAKPGGFGTDSVALGWDGPLA
ncbi:hypothetical protein JIR001_19370 [Polycladomyces abyssicola]|uniref:Uncharacterized protein n=1 Tax=Polycladomyces abyssicola TaxID=1125966 RepID=A0A8D5ZL51_9BACL|nr:hypothetical protein [Polycladomyces abyssicola]BCU82154.1 hypothetical protein JIR001_19370 [Polycladomyces abyssicola]